MLQLPPEPESCRLLPEPESCRMPHFLLRLPPELMNCRMLQLLLFRMSLTALLPLNFPQQCFLRTLHRMKLPPHPMYPKPLSPMYCLMLKLRLPSLRLLLPE